MKALNTSVFFLVFAVSCGTETRSSSHLATRAEDYDLSQNQMSQEGLFEVAYTTTPAPIPLNDYFDIFVMVAEISAGTDDLVLEVDARMPNHNHGMNVLPALEVEGRGKVRALGMLFHMPGHWEIAVTVSQGDIADRAIFNVYLAP